MGVACAHVTQVKPKRPYFEDLEVVCLEKTSHRASGYPVSTPGELQEQKSTLRGAIQGSAIYSYRKIYSIKIDDMTKIGC